MKNEPDKTQFDFIGDVHGHADKLEALLHQLGYSYSNGSYAHPTRKALFAGDYIDRGPLIKETLAIVKDMVDTDSAVALMGNHEYNAICFHMKNKEGGHLRKHSITHVIQHYETLRQFHNKEEEYEDYIEWFKTLPLFYETDDFRAVHACWDNDTINYLRSVLVNDRLTDELIVRSTNRTEPLYDAIEVTLKGKEMDLPDGQHFFDKEGTRRKEFRIRWWEDPAISTYKNISVHPIDQLPDTAIDVSVLKNPAFYSASEKPVFFGHYWLDGNPALYNSNVCCLDYSVANRGKLVAYRFNNESTLENGKIVFVK